jgi:hypothetical protein
VSESTDSVKDLTREAKWASDPETQKQSIEELGSYGKEAIPALEEVRTITAQDDIRKEVETAIRDITREEKNSTAQPKTGNQKKPFRGMAKKSSKSGAKKPSKESNKRRTSTRKTGKKKSTPKGMGKRQ